MAYGIVYLITNLANQKFYVGKTTKNEGQRNLKMGNGKGKTLSEAYLTQVHKYLHS